MAHHREFTVISMAEAEVTKLGIPLRAWEDYSYLLGLNTTDGLLDFGSAIRGIDPTYADDFWS